MAKDRGGKADLTGKKPADDDAAAGTALATQPKVAGLAKYQYDAEDEGAGFEGVTGEDMLIPFLNLLQKTSPQVDEDSPGHIPGAKSGMILNTATQELYDGDDGIRFVPLHRDHKYVEWAPRDSGGGFKGIHGPDDPMVLEARRGKAFGKIESPDGNDLAETFYVYGLILDNDGGYMPAMIAFASTQIKNYKRWMTTMKSIQLRGEDGRRMNPPMYAHIFLLRTRQQENTKGKWHGWLIGYDETVNPEGDSPAERARLPQEDERFQAAKSVRAMIQEGAVSVRYDAAAPEADGEGEEAGSVPAGGDPGNF